MVVVKISVSLPSELLYELDKYCERFGLTRSEAVRRAIRMLISHRPLEEREMSREYINYLYRETVVKRYGGITLLLSRIPYLSTEELVRILRICKAVKKANLPYDLTKVIYEIESELSRRKGEKK